MFRTICLLPLAVSLAACGDGAPEQSNATLPARPQVNAFQQKLLALNEVDRSLTLRRAIQDDSGYCPTVQGSAFQQDFKQMAMWVANCAGTAWAVYVGADGSVQARKCSQASELGLPECREVPESRPKSR